MNTHTYYIDIPEITITDRLEDSKHLSIKYIAEAAKRPVCINPACSHKLDPNRHDKVDYLLHDIKAEGKLVYIELHLRRYKCPECGSVFPDTYTFFTKRQHITHRLKQEFVNRVIKGEPFRYIANDYSIDPKTVAAAFQEYVDNHKEELNYTYTPEILGIDEAHIDDQYRLVLTDIKGQKLLDMKSNNLLRTVKNYLKTLDKTICKCVTMDFAPVYAKAVSEVLPDALIVIDKFHAVQDVNKCLDNLRKRVQKEHLNAGESAKRFKNSRKLFMANWEDVSIESRDQLKKWFKDIPEFHEGYMCKETFREIYNIAKTKAQAAEMFDKWIASIPAHPEFSGMKRTMTRRRDHILNYWDCGFTNAYTESVNNAIKAIEKRGRGYRFERLREMCILEINTPKPGRFDPRKEIYTSVNVNNDEVRKELYISTIKSKEGSQNFGNQPDSPNQAIIGWDIKASLSDLFGIYIDMDSVGLSANFEARIKAYYERLIACNLVS